MATRPGQDVALPPTEIPTGDDGVHIPHIATMVLAWAGDPLASGIVLGPRRKLVRHTGRYDEGLG